MINCENCHGEGLVGQGEKPWLRQGHIDTCKICNGTGKVETGSAGATAQEADEANAKQKASDDAVGEKIEGAADENDAAASDIEAAVDESTSANSAADATIKAETKQLG